MRITNFLEVSNDFVNKLQVFCDKRKHLIVIVITISFFLTMLFTAVKYPSIILKIANNVPSDGFVGAVIHYFKLMISIYPS
jgi:hypothetical protein